MAIRYDAGYNAKIAKVVKRFNQKRIRAIRQGYKEIPDPVKVSDLKARYSSRRELNKELTLLNKFSSGGANVLETVENSGGAVAIKWEFDHLKANAKQAKDFYARQYKIIASKLGRFPSERIRLDAIRNKVAALDVDLAYMNQKQFNAYKGVIRDYLSQASKRRGGYRGFMAQTLQIMRTVGIEEKDINRVMSKINTLSPEQFTQMYEQSDLISRIFELADSPIYTSGKLKLYTTQDDAKDLLNTLVEEVDDLVKKAKEEPEEVEYDPFNDFMESIGKDPYLQPERTPEGKIARSSLTRKQVSDLKALGWNDLIDETK